MLFSIYSAAIGAWDRATFFLVVYLAGLALAFKIEEEVKKRE